ncbi:MAG: ABC transporter substrate-binding protein, partial [Gammaproteobacteria bacterium]|nr:ABC transporter substrate-binding protein [Gammaproteobacteria bacterium]
EYVVRRDPDVILIPAGERARLADRPGWSGIRAVRSGRICTLGTDQRNMIMRPGPRVAQGLQAIAACLERLPP